MRVWHLDRKTQKNQSVFLSAENLTKAVSDSESLLIVLEINGKIEGFIWTLIDHQQQLSKIMWACVSPTLSIGGP